MRPSRGAPTAEPPSRRGCHRRAQTAAITEALASGRGGQGSITTVKTDVAWPTLTDDKSDARDVVMFYEEFEDVCALANNARERLLALRGRCRGSRLKTYTNAYRAAWKSGEVLNTLGGVRCTLESRRNTLSSPRWPRVDSQATSSNLSSRRRSQSWRRSA